MPRKAAHTAEELASLALEPFWRRGYAETSAADLVAATGVSRHGIYTAFDGKHALYLACFEAYQERVVTPALAPVEAPGADLAAIRGYFTTQFDLADAMAPPRPGCFAANAMTERAAYDDAARAKVGAHNERLKSAFLNAFITRNAARRGGPLPAEELDALADMLAAATQGFWSMSRAMDDLTPLRRATETLLALIERRIE